MANNPLEVFHLGRLRALRGDALVTYPYGSVDYPRVERVRTVERVDSPRTFMTADGQYSGLVLTDQRIVGGDHVHVELYERYDKLPGPELTSYVYDPLTESLVEETRQTVATATANPSITALFTSFRSVPINLLMKQFITRKYPASVTGKTIVSYEPEKVMYPAIMTGVTTDILTRKDGTTYAFVLPTIIAERPRRVVKQITRTFTTAAPTESSILSGWYVEEPVRHRYGGVHFNFFTGPVLCDAVELVYTSGSDDPIWEPDVETYSHDASTPTATAYLASVAAGEWKTFHKGSRKIAEGLYMLTEVKMPLL